MASHTSPKERTHRKVPQEIQDLARGEFLLGDGGVKNPPQVVTLEHFPLLGARPWGYDWRVTHRESTRDLTLCSWGHPPRGSQGLELLGCGGGPQEPRLERYLMVNLDHSLVSLTGR